MRKEEPEKAAARTLGEPNKRMQFLLNALPAPSAKKDRGQK